MTKWIRYFPIEENESALRQLGREPIWVGGMKNGQLEANHKENPEARPRHGGRSIAFHVNR